MQLGRHCVDALVAIKPSTYYTLKSAFKLIRIYVLKY